MFLEQNYSMFFQVFKIFFYFSFHLGVLIRVTAWFAKNGMVDSDQI